MATLQPAAEADVVHRALVKLQHAHPQLRAALVRENGDIFLDTQAGGAVELRTYDGSSEEAFNAELHDPLKPERCGWRAALCGPHLLLTYHHAFMDGRGIMVVLQGLLAAMAGQAFEPPAGTERGLETYFENDFPWPREAIRPAPRLAHASGPCLRARPERSVPGHQRRQCWCRRKLPGAAVQRLLGLCRENGTTVQGALGAATAISLSSIFDGPPAVKMFLGVDCRPVCKRDPRSLACCALSITSIVATDLPFWDVARKHRQDIVERMALQEHLPNYNHNEAVHPNFEFTLTTAGHQSQKIAPERNLVQISNRGAYRLSSGSYSISEVSFVQFGAPDPTHALFFTNACTIDGVLCITLTYDSPSISDGVASALADAIMGQLQQALAIEHPTAGPEGSVEDGDRESLASRVPDGALPDDAGQGVAAEEATLWASGTGRGTTSFKYRYMGQDLVAVGWFEQAGHDHDWVSRNGDPDDPSTWRPRNMFRALRLQGDHILNETHSCKIERNSDGVVTLLTWSGGFQWRLLDTPSPGAAVPQGLS